MAVELGVALEQLQQIELREKISKAEDQFSSDRTLSEVGMGHHTETVAERNFLIRDGFERVVNSDGGDIPEDLVDALVEKSIILNRNVDFSDKTSIKVKLLEKNTKVLEAIKVLENALNGGDIDFDTIIDNGYVDCMGGCCGGGCGCDRGCRPQ